MTTVLSDAVPWFVWEVVHFLEGWLRPEMKVWEWGAGGSTIFFAHRCAEVISVEHDVACIAPLEMELRKWNLEQKVQLLYRPAQVGWLEEYSSLHGPFLNSHNLKDYVQAIHAWPEAYFDLVVVDGRARPACVREGWRHVAPGGVLLLDNTERDYYKVGTDTIPSTWAHVPYWGHGPYLGWEWGTDIWLRPAEEAGYRR